MWSIPSVLLKCPLVFLLPNILGIPSRLTLLLFEINELESSRGIGSRIRTSTLLSPTGRNCHNECNTSTTVFHCMVFTFSRCTVSQAIQGNLFRSINSWAVRVPPKYFTVLNQAANCRPLIAGCFWTTHSLKPGAFIWVLKPYHGAWQSVLCFQDNSSKHSQTGGEVSRSDL